MQPPENRVWWPTNIPVDFHKPHIFLVRAPITFGHSQLLIPGTQSDADGFAKAVPVIKTAIDVFSMTLPKLVSQYQELARHTRTTGIYRKLLILRTSASEEDAFTVALLPYFASHEHECHKLFHSMHHDPCEDKGGLLAWLGKREAEVDNIEVDCPSASAKEALGDYLNLPDLATRLRDAVPPEDRLGGS